MSSTVVYKQKYALIIGINTYPCNSLKYCINDARDLTETLRRIGFIVLLKKNCNLDEFYSIIDYFASILQEDDLALFYFAGHGKQNNYENYLFPSDYDYDLQQLEAEHQFIVGHAISVKYIMQKISGRKCRIAIYLFDCCRNLVRTRGTNVDQGLTHMNAPKRALIVYACAPGETVQDETRNDRNGSFIQNLLEHIATTDKDIEEIMKDVAIAVNSQTGSFQLPYRTSSLEGKVFLMASSDEGHRDLRPLRNVPPRERLLSASYEHHRSNDNNATFVPTTSLHITPIPTEHRKWPSSMSSNNDNNYPVQNTPGRQFNPTERTTPMPKVDGSNSRHSKNQSQMIQISTDYITTETVPQSTDVPRRKTYTNKSQESWHTPRPAPTPRSSIYDKYFPSDDDDDAEGNASKESKPTMDKRSVQAQPMGKAKFVKSIVKIADQSNPNDQSTYSPAPTIMDTIVFVQSLKVRYKLHIPVDSTIRQLKKTIWQNINVNVERCQEQSYTLLLFTHRMHIFLGEEEELVSEFMKLTPSEPHFYFYALRRPQQCDEMYTYETKTSHLFSTNTDWWNPVHFMEDAQLPRPQSVLLSSLYALRLFFYKSNDGLSMWHQAMEAQFFVQLRKYLFPPAVLALKHAMEGSLFWFEKPLIVDSLLQLLALLCPDKIKRNELCDCIPLLFCWLLEQCDPTATESDFYQVVNLVDVKGEERRYFNDPATVVNANPVPLIIREREKIPFGSVRHVDIRSFTRYMQNKTNYANISYCKCEDYVIYDPPKSMYVPIETISHFTNDQIKQLYETMARKYQPFTLITRGALSSDINDQLVVMQDRTVALIFARKNAGRSKTTADQFEIFHPLQYEVGKKQYVRPDELYQLPKSNTQDRSLPEHLQLNVCEVPHTGSVHDPNVNAPIQQITVVVLDISRSMFEKPASPDPNDPKSVLDMSIIMLGTMSDNIAFERCTHHVGLIHFGTSVEVICPITRNRAEFEKALSIQPKQQEWTSMYDALSRATTLIRCYEQNNEKYLASDCRKLVICISDGIENHSSTTIEQLGDRLKKYNIMVDFISFLRDELLTKNEKDKVSSFRRLCKNTHGYVYQNLPLSNIELGATFEQEAAVWVCERESKSYGFVEKPIRRMPAQLHQRATDRVPTQFAQSIQGTPNYHRVLREANNTIKTQMDNIHVYICRNDIYFWKIILDGLSETPYEGGHWMLYVYFTDQYPRQPPKIRFVTEIYHVNVSADGRICHHLFDRGWSNNTTMIEVFQSILELLREPNFDDAISIEKAQLKRDEPNEYNRQLKKCVQQHSSESLHQLKMDFELEDF